MEYDLKRRVQRSHPIPPQKIDNYLDSHQDDALPSVFLAECYPATIVTARANEE